MENRIALNSAIFAFLKWGYRVHKLHSSGISTYNVNSIVFTKVSLGICGKLHYICIQSIIY
jgi:hypothetical protein